MNHEVGLKLKQMFEIADELFAGTDIKVSWVHVSIDHKNLLQHIPKEDADIIKQSLLDAGFVAEKKEFKHDHIEQSFVPETSRRRYVCVSSEINEAERIERLVMEREATQKQIDILQERLLAKDPDSERSAV